jgi:hypothetical protein
MTAGWRIPVSTLHVPGLAAPIALRMAPGPLAALGPASKGQQKC